MSLDEKIGNILWKYHMYEHLVGADALYSSADVVPRLMKEQAIEQIKQAFINEGWRDFGNELPETILRTYWKSTEAGKKKFVELDGKHVMSGQEWLNRFTQEFETLLKSSTSPLVADIAMEAARKASGVEEE